MVFTLASDANLYFDNVKNQLISWVDDDDSNKTHTIRIKPDQPYEARRAGYVISKLYRLTCATATDAGDPVPAGSLIPNKWRRTIHIKCGKKMVELFKLGEMDVEGHFLINRTTNHSKLIPIWFTEHAAKEIISKADIELLG